MSRPGGTDPFAVLGLPASHGLGDDEVRAAWRRVAAATHPDRADGGNPARFADAAAAYTALRTRAARGETLADLAEQGPAQPRDAGRWAALAQLAGRARRGRPARLALRLAAAALTVTGAVTAVGLRPATPALITGVLTWLALTARHDLAPPRR